MNVRRWHGRTLTPSGTASWMHVGESFILSIAKCDDDTWYACFSHGRVTIQARGEKTERAARRRVDLKLRAMFEALCQLIGVAPVGPAGPCAPVAPVDPGCPAGAVTIDGTDAPPLACGNDRSLTSDRPPGSRGIVSLPSGLKV